MTATILEIIAVLLMFIGFILMVKFEYHDGWLLPVICPCLLCIIGVSIYFTPPLKAKCEAKRLAIEKQQQEIEARNNRCIEDLSKRYNLSPETIKFLMDNGSKLPCLPVNQNS